MSGTYFGYICYDMVHYYLHHARVFEFHFKEMKTYHLAHHYKNYDNGYGITSKVWDRVCILSVFLSLLSTMSDIILFRCANRCFYHACSHHKVFGTLLEM